MLGKRYIAFNSGTNANSGVQTHAKAFEWAKKEIANKHGVHAIIICEAIEVIERTEPAVKTRPFLAEVEEAEAA